MSYNQLFQCYYQPLCQYVYSLLEDKDDAEDVVQELFLKLWKDRGKIVITESASSYLGFTENSEGLCSTQREWVFLP